ncbi:cytochrome c oxidase copper chaperone-like isoform X2 [Scylla paramamosain]|uniref:cytochrome c oxidase copper chaperone-like isoform X2 n=1 Tax=Scylla paramamosain TaxID=85552 RepID=UPI0030834DA1
MRGRGLREEMDAVLPQSSLPDTRRSTGPRHTFRMSDEQPTTSIPAEGDAPACPETNTALQQCITENGETNCAALLEAHQECLKKLGMQV